MKPVLIDTGVIVALLDTTEQNHAACVEAAESMSAPLVTCEAVIAESCHLLRKVAGAPEIILENVAKGIFEIPFRISQSAKGVQKLFGKYRDSGIDFADACLVHLATEIGTGDILTLDSDFRFYRWSGDKPFRILPQL